jgi:glutathione peroxidase
MRKILTILGVITMISIFNNANAENLPNDVYGLSFTDISGEAMPLSKFKDKVLLVVNTASHCGFTEQYEGLQSLYKKYAEKGLVIIAVPSGDFGGQEFDDNAEIKEFCETKFAVEFELTEKEKVSGDGAHPFYEYAGEKLGFGTKPKWNFHKYLVNRKGEVVDYFNSTTKPESDKVVKKIEELLGK